MNGYVRRALKEIYNKKVDVRKEIDPSLFSGTLSVFNSAVDDYFNDDDAFGKALKTNNEVYAAFRTHRMQNDIAAQLTDDEGKLKPFNKFKQDVEGITDHHVNRWMRTEYDTAVLRAHQAANWQEYEKDKDVMPNLRWVPSTSATPGEDHMPFWGTVLPIDDPFWKEHRPGDRWNCKCDLEQTDDPIVRKKDIKPTSKTMPAQGLENNPGKDKKLFSDKGPFFPSSCATCPFNTGTKNAKDGKKDCYQCEKIIEILAPTIVVKTFSNGAKIEVDKRVDTEASDYKNILSACEGFAIQFGRSSIITPKFNNTKVNPDYPKVYGSLKGTKFYGSCPDLLVDKKYWYEHEGFKKKEDGSINNPITKMKNMLKRGLKQSNRLIIEDSGVSDRFLSENIRNRIIFEHQDIEEVWVRRSNGNVDQIWPKKTGRDDNK